MSVIQKQNADKEEVPPPPAKNLLILPTKFLYLPPHQKSLSQTK